MDSKNLSNMQKDVLREIGNIGAGNAATSMSQLIDKHVLMEVPSVKVVTINEMMELIGGPEKLIVAIFFRIKGEVPGTVYFILTIEEAEYLVKQMMMQDDAKLLIDDEPNELALSALQEVANIMTGSYLSALSDFTNLKMTTSVPYLSIDMAGATLVTGMIELARITDYAIIIDTKINSMSDENDNVRGHFLLVPDPDSIDQLFASLGIDGHV